MSTPSGVADALRVADPAQASDIGSLAATMVADNRKTTGRIDESFDGERGTELGADAQTG